MTGTDRPQPPRATANPSPVRRPGSIRRTSSIDVTWPGGPLKSRQMAGRSRDILTPRDGGKELVRASATMIAMVNFSRVIEEISADPAPAALQKLVGQRGGGHLRQALREFLPELIEEALPLYLLLDDISGLSLISGWALALWYPDALDKMRHLVPAEQLESLQDRAGVCWGLKPGNSGLDGSHNMMSVAPADGGALRNPLDPLGWHDLPDDTGMSMRRARRVDVWREAGVIRVEAAFQDSAPMPEGGRAALHEYVIHAAVDPATMALQSLVPEPRVLPFHECPGAVVNAMKLVGTPIADMRQAVLEQLRGDVGCTHLNDALRSMAEVPSLLAFLDDNLA